MMFFYGWSGSANMLKVDCARIQQSDANQDAKSSLWIISAIFLLLVFALHRLTNKDKNSTRERAQNGTGKRKVLSSKSVCIAMNKVLSAYARLFLSVQL